MKDTLVLWVTDRGYLAPSTLVAEQALAQGIGDIADLAIFTLDVDEDAARQLEREVAHPAFSIYPMRNRDFQPPPNTEFHANHVPVAALARLSIEPEIPAQYRRLIYLDGDLQIRGPIRPLVERVVPEGKVAAGRGSSWLDPSGQHGLEPAGYLETLGVAKADYFNSGVMAFGRDTWADMAPRALDLFFRNSSAYIRHDQSALNAAFRGQVEHFHPAYNFHTFYATAYAQTFVKPRIIHFTGRAKPWHTWAPPWGARFADSYRGLVRRHPALADYFEVAIPRASPDVLRKRARLSLREARRLAQRERDTVRFRRRLIRRYVSDTDFTF
ncbi:glycosyltransferase family 8 protein [Nocardioides sp. Leaf307]|uniref:glycosyltransferase family 8 protein n=1 Tax=Nocardioides sp. Leaf307 TaxID=1736331 RepID=UPI00070301D0|nr:glycosyltransferase [Nocardioides sp. Leaf307]KQQ43702.1 hypothetical protein ASF50_07325 [Nocardioides sp. Leaf307]